MTNLVTAQYDFKGNQVLSPNAVPAYPSSYILEQSGVTRTLTNTLVETVLANIKIPANSIGPNGSIRLNVVWNMYNNVNNKSMFVKFGNWQVTSQVMNNTQTYKEERQIHNRGAANAQVAFAGAVGGFGTSALNPNLANIDTTVDQFLTLSAQLTVATDILTLASYCVEILPSA